MKIDNVTPLQQVQKADQNKTDGKAPVAAPSPVPANPSIEAHLSQATRDSSKDIDTVRVEELRQAIQDGRLEIDSEKIAEGLIATVRGMLDRES